MIWQPSHLTRGQMEERRRSAARLLRRRKRLSQAEIARRLGVSRASVSDWAHQLAAGGLRQLRRRQASGRPRKLTHEQEKRLRRLLRRGAKAAGFPTNRWTLKRIQSLIQCEFQVIYHPNAVARVLQRWDWSPQVPLPRAQERDEELIQAWLAHDWPRIKKSAAARRRYRILR